MPDKLWYIKAGTHSVGQIWASSAAEAKKKAESDFGRYYGDGTIVKYTAKLKKRGNPKKKQKKSGAKRVSAALSRFLKKQNPSKMKGVTKVRVKKLKGGGVTITPVR